MNKMGMLHIYCGDGKGKTTAAIGLAVRAAGAGMSVFIAQLMKGRDSSEVGVLRTLPAVTLVRCEKDLGFVKNMSEADKEQMKVYHDDMLKKASVCGCDMIILDEFFSAYNYGLLDREYARRAVFSLLENAEVILTGRSPDKIFTGRADYISEIKAVRHPYEKGITARKGIEF